MIASHPAYKPIVGLEIHVELKTRTKMFCDSPNNPDEPQPNRNVCPVCLGHPGALPVANREAIRQVLLVGKALDGEISPVAHFDRKSYFYPDLPKGYQISQYDQPFVSGGNLAGVQIRRIHLEEDTAKLLHDERTGETLVDFNRAGVPLMELVTEPVIGSGLAARRFTEELQLVLRYLDVSDADMEKGHMRLEANISVAATGLGTKVEIKNLNSFRALTAAIEYEARRQTEVLSAGGKVIQETRGFDEKKGTTFPQREKEEAHDYRYLADPDLPPISTMPILETVGLLPELPEAKRERYRKSWGMRREIIEALVGDPQAASYFEKVALLLKEREAVNLASNYIASDLSGLCRIRGFSFENLPLSPEKFSSVMKMIAARMISSRVAKDLLAKLFLEDVDPEELVKREGLEQEKSEEELTALVKLILKENPQATDDLSKGKAKAGQFLLGKAMKMTKGAIDPEIFKKLLNQSLSRGE